MSNAIAKRTGFFGRVLDRVTGRAALQAQVDALARQLREMQDCFESYPPSADLVCEMQLDEAVEAAVSERFEDYEAVDEQAVRKMIEEEIGELDDRIADVNKRVEDFIESDALGDFERRMDDMQADIDDAKESADLAITQDELEEQLGRYSTADEIENMVDTMIADELKDAVRSAVEDAIEDEIISRDLTDETWVIEFVEARMAKFFVDDIERSRPWKWAIDKMNEERVAREAAMLHAAFSAFTSCFYTDWAYELN